VAARAAEPDRDGLRHCFVSAAASLPAPERGSISVMPTLLWFRRDLRLADLPPLLDAARPDGQVLACYVLDPRLAKSSGPRRLQYLHDALRALNDRLGGRLLVTRGRPEERIPVLAGAIGATSVHVSADYAPFGTRRDDAVRTALGDVALAASGSPYLVAPGRVAKSDGTPYKVFSPYFTAWRRHGWRAPAKTGPTSAQWLDPADVPGPDLRVDIPDDGVALDLPAGEQAAQRQWEAFVAHGLAGYADDRNRPDLDITSRMSAHLKFGTIHPRSMVGDLGRGTGGPAYLRELAFRDFYAAVLHEWPHSVWWNWNRGFDAIKTDEGATAEQRFEAWKQGRTGFPIVDAGMRQLAGIGWMHNRVRMIVASFLVKDLHLPWQWGARWFLDQLVDGDMANNQHGWQWTAGSGTDAAPFFRVFNPITQGQKFDPDGSYIRRWVPELAALPAGADVHKLAAGRPEGYPEPIVDHAAERAEALRRYADLG
jgi:deoxyribodipyrimidine photo-lyase